MLPLLLPLVPLPLPSGVMVSDNLMETNQLLSPVLFPGSPISPPHGHNYILTPPLSPVIVEVGTPTFIYDFGTTFILDGAELPYVSNNGESKMDLRLRPPPQNMEYYVPPIVDDKDFFGGQQQLWQGQMIKYFSKFGPDIWRLQGVPDYYNRNPNDGWITFSITSKLRYCCRSCGVAWTSKKGKIMFSFIKDMACRRGWVVMKLFGQICMRCEDCVFQRPACYPEEIERAVLKLSEYIGGVYYGIPVSTKLFEDCTMSIRAGDKHPRRQPSLPNYHRKELCQACITGVCQAQRFTSTIVY